MQKVRLQINTDRKFKLEDGRLLCYSEYGDLDGKPVFHFHGSCGSRLERPLDESVLSDLGIRFIATDRPGHGLSDPQSERTLLDWPDDIRQLANYLEIDRFHVLGWSAGGPYSLACAYKLHNRVLAGSTVSGLAPPDRPNPYQGLQFQFKVFMFAARHFPKSMYLLRRTGYNSIQRQSENSIKIGGFPPVDMELLQIEENNRMLFEDIKEGYRQGWQGPAQDDIIINSPWGFEIDDIRVRIDIWQGELDKNVPLNQGQYLHEKIPNSRFNVLPGQGHLYLLARWRDVLKSLLKS